MGRIIFLIVSLLNALAQITAETRIAGGDTAEISAYPYATALLTNGGADAAYLQACGGTIISNNAILSAASCFYTNETADLPNWWRARIGTSDSTRSGTIHLIRRIDAHPQFSPTTLVNDIAVLRTSINMVFQAGRVEAARIIGGAYTLSANQPVWAIGWGTTTSGGQFSEQLRQVQFWVVNQQTCANRYAGLGFTVTDNMVCAGWLDVGVRGQCQGDAGSPLVEDGAVVGIHSWVEGCADDWYPGVNTRLAPYSRWIVETAVSA